MPRHTIQVGDVDVDEDTWYQAMEEASMHTPVTRGRMLLSMAIMCAFGVAVVLADTLRSIVAWIIAGLIVGATVVIAIMIPLLGGPSERTRQLYLALNRRGIRVCTSCGYDLRGLPLHAHACPECGTACDSIVNEVTHEPEAMGQDQRH